MIWAFVSSVAIMVIAYVIACGVSWVVNVVIERVRRS